MVGVRRPPSSVHSGCKSDYIEEQYHQFNVKSKHAVSTLLHNGWVLVFSVTNNYLYGRWMFLGFDLVELEPYYRLHT
jgi:hypothetical protein